MLDLLRQPPILKKEQRQPEEQKSKQQEAWLLRVVGLVGAAVGSQLALLAELYEHRLGGFISGSFDALKRSYQAYCEEEEIQQRIPVKGLLDPFNCNNWVFACKQAPLSKVQKATDQLCELFRGAGKGPEIKARVGQAHVWYERIHMREQLKESGYVKPLYVFLGDDLPLLKETVHNFQPGFLNWSSTLIYSVAGGALAAGAAYSAIQTVRWLHGALLVQPPKRT